MGQFEPEINRDITMTFKQDEIDAVALEAYGHIVRAWHLSRREAAGLADMSESRWKRAKTPGSTIRLTNDQRLRLSAIVGIHAALEQYFSDPLTKTWLTRPNTGPLFHGARPIDVAIARGLPQILTIRNYVDALCCGA
ncbi:MAG: hypothetical protein ACJAVT_000414 [Yoonia sp.]|jgi:uncharacterized protein (DUF2384 family)